jgi:hypothetical protein
MKILNIKKNTVLIIAYLMGAVVLLNNCNDPSNPPQPTNDEELITTVRLEFTDTLSGKKLNYYFRDLDGEGGNNPSQWDTIQLDSNSFYNVALILLNESNPNGIENISAEIFAEKEDHILCYETSFLNANIERTDSANNFALGLKTNWKTGSKSEGNVVIILKHQPGIKDGTCSPGETDVEVKFQAKID